jgi:hypothetical protein
MASLQNFYLSQHYSLWCRHNSFKKRFQETNDLREKLLLMDLLKSTLLKMIYLLENFIDEDNYHLCNSTEDWEPLSA